MHAFPFAASVGAGALLVGGSGFVGGDLRAGYRSWLASGSDPFIGDVVGLDLRLRALASVTGEASGSWLSASLRPWLATRDDYLFGQWGLRQPSALGVLVPEAGIAWRGAGLAALALTWSAPVAIWLSPQYCVDQGATSTCRRRQRPYHLGEHLALEIAPELDLFVSFASGRVEPAFGLTTSLLAW
jgi:hypothetical protein